MILSIFGQQASSPSGIQNFELRVRLVVFSKGLGRQKADCRNSFVGEDITKIWDFFFLGSSSPPLFTSESAWSHGLLELLRPAVLAASRFSTLLDSCWRRSNVFLARSTSQYLLFKRVMKSLQSHPYYTTTVNCKVSTSIF